MSTEPSERRQAVERVDDPFVRGVTKGAYHFKRYAPFYVIGLLFVLAVTFFPSVDVAESVSAGSDDIGSFESDNGVTGDVAGDGGDTAVGDPGVVDPGATDASGAPIGNTGAAARPGSTSGRTTGTQVYGAAVVPQTGKTRGGIDCKPGVRQLPISYYATSCRPAFQGDNGGATFRGVTKDEIVIVRRNFPDTANSQAVDQINAQAGFASSDVTKKVRNEVFLPWFNKMYELYGRKVKWIEYESQNGDSTAEAQSKGREGACADATQIVETLKAFAVASAGGSSPFSECAAERKLMVTNAAAYFPDAFYRKYSPYLYHTLMDCERIAYQVAEYTGKRLLNRKAKWAGDPLFQQQNRKFGIYVPDNDGYQRCTDIAVKVLTEKYGGAKPARYNYQLDISRFPDQAAQAIVQFKAAGVTTINNSCDYYSTIFLTQAAKNQEYFPEWQIIGVAAQDTDNAARLFDQEEVNGHMFGMSQLGATSKLIGPQSEPGRIYKLITGKDIPAGTTGNYYELVHLFNLLQAGGPNLTPQNIFANLKNIPDGGGTERPYGYWSLQQGSDGTNGKGDYTEVDDGREVFWVSDPSQPTAGGSGKSSDAYYNGGDGKNGTYRESYGGKRFRNGEWPAEEPPVYPKR